VRRDDACYLVLGVRLTGDQVKEMIELASQRLARVANERYVDDRLSTIGERTWIVWLFLPDVAIDRHVGTQQIDVSPAVGVQDAPATFATSRCGMNRSTRSMSWMSRSYTTLSAIRGATGE